MIYCGDCNKKIIKGTLLEHITEAHQHWYMQIKKDEEIRNDRIKSNVK